MLNRSKSLLNSINLDGAAVSFSNTVKNLGVTFDESLLFKDHINSIFRSSFCTLKNLKTIRSHFDRLSFETIVHAFVTTRLDYCNSLYSGVHSIILRPLSLIQNFAARLIFRRGKFSHVTPLLIELHWLPVPYRIDFKILLFTYKAINSIGPSYLSNLITLRPHLRHLRSNSAPLLDIPRFRSARFGNRAFSLCAPKLWNSLPNTLRSISTLSTFKSQLKTYLFKKAFNL